MTSFFFLRFLFSSLSRGAMSSLAAQLSSLQARQGHVLPHRHKAASLLFSPEDAKKVDYETALNLGVNGVVELASHEPTFSRYLDGDGLFAATSASRDRMMLGKEENRRLDRDIETFLLQLGKYGMLKAAAKALEYLVRRYLIHALNVDQLIAFALPFHQTELFVKIIQVDCPSPFPSTVY
jgi:U3 small nucleolar RNA-associated protein 10